MVTSFTFGGENLTDVYVTFGMVGLTKVQLEKQPSAGALFVIKKSGYHCGSAAEFALHSENS